MVLGVLWYNVAYECSRLGASLYGDMTPDDQGNFLFSDEVIDGWLTLAGGSAYRAAAIALRALAADQA